ncbi:YgiT-type zinc finger protein [Paenibacillus sp. FSL K6-1122]|uniref:YgiT-type zinc finger protein n=1 Tax=Paenibacillus sp. FSL K6-1122 TaxID=2954512 RepID=UPI0030ECC7A5
MNKLTKCVECGSTSLIEISHTMEHNEDGKVFVIENIPVTQCNVCNDIYLSPEANRYIDKQLSIFRSGGFDNKAKEVTKSKGITQEELGNRLSVTKQRANQILHDYNLDVQTMIKVASAINEPVKNVFDFRSIQEKDNKFYIS